MAVLLDAHALQVPATSCPIVFVLRRATVLRAPNLSIVGPMSSSVFSRSRGDIRRHALNTRQPATMTATRAY